MKTKREIRVCIYCHKEQGPCGADAFYKHVIKCGKQPRGRARKQPGIRLGDAGTSF